MKHVLHMALLAALIILAGLPSVLHGATIRYVSPSGLHLSPFTNWVAAATNISAAVHLSVDGDKIMVTNGTYLLFSPVVMSAGVEIASVNGPLFTILDGAQTSRCCVLNHSNAILNGFTVQNGRTGAPDLWNGNGGGILCLSGIVQDCVITGNLARLVQYPTFGGGIYCESGRVERCIVASNSCESDGGGVVIIQGVLQDTLIIGNSAASVGGVISAAEVMENCQVANNTDMSVVGGVALLGGALMRNCLVVSNESAGFCGGIGIFQGNAQVQNCTVVRNVAPVCGGLAAFDSAIIANCIIHNNSGGNFTNATATASVDVRYSCSIPLIPGPGNITNTPRFVDAAAGDYHLLSGSPCIDAGSTNGAPDRDLDGVPRPLDGDSNGVAAVDMGAFEFSCWQTNTHYVSLSGGHQSPYTNWVMAATNIQAAVDASTGGGTVLVANGTFALTAEITVGTNLVVRSANGASATIVDGGLTTRCFRLLPDAGCTLRGFTITNAVAATEDQWGGGVWMGSNNVVMDSVFVACTARCGGAVYANLSTVSNCTFIGNAAELSGGGLHGDGVRVLNCTFERNVAFIGGGMIETWTGPFPAMRDCTFVGNTASCGGGACCGSLTNVSTVITNLLPMMDSLTNLTPQLNQVQYVLTNMLSQLPQELGSSLKAATAGEQLRVLPLALSGAGESTAGDILRCIMISNTADYGGGLFILDTPDLITSNCVFSDNHAKSGGGVFALNAGELCGTTMVGNDASFLGGGALVLGAGLLRHCNVVSNHAVFAGGGSMVGSLSDFLSTNVVMRLAVSETTADLARVVNSEFLGNSAGTMGGGLMLVVGTLAEGVDIIRNDATWGGGVANWGGSLREANVISNSASFGGGLFATGGDVYNCTLQGNSADSIGGGVIALAASGSVTIRNCLVGDNFARAGGGMGLSMDAQVQACEISSNRATQAGGGVFCIGGGDLQSSLVTRNAAHDGGGVYCLNGGRLVNNTITGNVASNTAGGLCVVTNVPGGPPSPKNAAISNTIIYGNTASQGSNFLNIGTNVSYSYCCTFPAPETGGEGNITNNPALTPSGRLKSTSPCIDAGTAFNAPPTDIDSEARWDDPRHSNVVSIVDIGADEFVDTDLDSMADYWETECFGGLTNRNGTADEDHDALNDLAEYENSTSPTNSDTDADQMPDGWEVTAGLDPRSGAGDSGTTGDPDGDEASNLAEYISDTQPKNADSVLRLFSIKREHGGVRIDWKGGVQAWQFLECREDLTNTNEEWLPILGIPPPTQITNAVIDMGATNRVLFYRIKAER